MRKNALLVVALVFVSVTLSFAGLLLAARFQLNDLTAVPMEEGDTPYPKVPLGLAQQGEIHYQALGCASCHTQVVRRQFVGGDFEQGWAKSSSGDLLPRQTVPHDYLYNKTSVIGTNRVGPDLTNVGARYTKEELHAYLQEAHGTMPAYNYLYEEKDGKIIPSAKAVQLVAYLDSLDKSYPLPSAPAFIEKVEEVEEALETATEGTAEAKPAEHE